MNSTTVPVTHTHMYAQFHPALVFVAFVMECLALGDEPTRLMAQNIIPEEGELKVVLRREEQLLNEYWWEHKPQTRQ